ncbi:Vta1 like-domain-containing protein [Myxozyma melibiosi]|uniref:Vta1 like-domain-containing protein n=1 Tax=Myxozyma melibiosi TaxID=54550 RepID=A0ABR1FB01_9ASCO
MTTLTPPPPSLKFIQPFIARARELERADPVISYYCKYYAIEEALASKVHQSDPEAAEYVTNLLDVVETEKNALSDRDTINDEMVAQAYVEKFASRVFANADKDLINKTATKSTATNLLAASNFLELLKLFGDPDQTLLDQIKYCKFHAVRIQRALKLGEDPNVYEDPRATQKQEQESEVEQHDEQQQQQQISPQHSAASSTISAGSPPPPSAPARSFSPVPPSAPPASHFSPSAPPSTTTPSSTSSYNVSSSSSSSKPQESVQQIMDEAQRFTLAQKHSKFAISALNYEDVGTAVKELKTALRLLGENV